MADKLLEARNLKKVFSQRRGIFASRDTTITAVEGVNVSLGQGEAVGLVGESGSGKTTLASILVGLLKPDAGEVFLEGNPFLSGSNEMQRRQRRKVQYIFQNPLNCLNPRLTVEEALREPLLVHRLIEQGKTSQRIDALLAMVQLPANYRKRLPHQLSGGERQRVGIARALAVEPQILICDEPIASLDVSVGVKILALLSHINQQQKTALLFISHDLRAVAKLCRRIVVMHQGKVVEEGVTSQITQRPQQPYTQLLLSSAALNL